jgi:hypothetical protein
MCRFLCPVAYQGVLEVVDCAVGNRETRNLKVKARTQDIDLYMTTKIV